MKEIIWEQEHLTAADGHMAANAAMKGQSTAVFAAK